MALLFWLAVSVLVQIVSSFQVVPQTTPFQWIPSFASRQDPIKHPIYRSRSSALQSPPSSIRHRSRRQQWLLDLVWRLRELIREFFQRYTVYVLECEQQKYYVGSTTNVKRRLQEHFSERGGSAWTRLHRPIRIVETHRRIPQKYSLGAEAQVTAKFMKLHGVQNVRGAMFSYVRNLTHRDTDALVGFLGHYNDESYPVVRAELEEQFGQKRPKNRGPVPTDVCFHCGGLGHWQRDCPKRQQNC